MGDNHNSANSKRIAKNTLMLYFRMLITMGVSLYTSRVVLNALGVEDFGIYSVVGGVVSMFTMISSSLSSAISRFITFELGRGDQRRLNEIFSTSVIIQFIIGAVIILLVESVGVWFLTNKMVIPPDRLYAAKWVLHFSMLTLVINLVSVPYSAAIIAHEKMSAFAYIGIIDVMGKLAISFLILIPTEDSRLIYYAVGMAAVALFIRLIYGFYCKRHFEECRFRWVFDKRLFGEMFGFAGWNFIGNASAILRDQGGNIILNMFAGGPVVNAARGVSMQVSSAVQGFSTNFMTALNPQITKSYANGEHHYMMTLIFQGARLSFYMLLMLSLPVLISTSYLLELWLGVVPEYSVIFVQLALVFSMGESISRPLITAQLATGDIRNYQLVVGGLQMLNLPISYFLLKMGFLPPTILIVAIAISMCCLAARLYMLRGMIDLSVGDYLRRVLLNVAMVSVVSAVVPYIVKGQLEDDFIGFVLSSVVCVVSAAGSIYLLGCSSEERQFIHRQILKRISK